MNKSDNAIVELVVRNHPGVMTHITGLFARRAFNLEGIVCSRIGDGHESRMYLLVKNDDLVEQIIKQLQKLYDVRKVTFHEDYDSTIFNRLDEIIKGE
ncbi:MAG: acetolactate synthase small subunit [Bacillota bacterium]|nr:acetolactate synthase small subunit [Bacillota bacterium]